MDTGETGLHLCLRQTKHFFYELEMPRKQALAILTIFLFIIRVCILCKLIRKLCSNVNQKFTDFLRKSILPFSSGRAQAVLLHRRLGGGGEQV